VGLLLAYARDMYCPWHIRQSGLHDVNRQMAGFCKHSNKPSGSLKLENCVIAAFRPGISGILALLGCYAV
jgi:hypothetical protein